MQSYWTGSGLPDLIKKYFLINKILTLTSSNILLI